MQVFTFLQGQPANLHYSFGSQWSDSLLNNRGITNAVTIQSTETGIGAFLFNTASGVYIPKWCGSNQDYNRVVNQKITGGAYYYASGGWDHDLTFPVQTNYYYTFITGQNTDINNDMSVLETAYNPVNISSVTQQPALIIAPFQSVNITVTLSNQKNVNENVFIRYSTDNWLTSTFLQVISFNLNNQGVVTIQGLAGGTTVSYYALTTEQTTTDATTIDYYTLKLNNNNNFNYSYIVSTLVPSCTISVTPALIETNLNGSNILLHLENTEFVDATLTTTNFTLNNVPAGISINAVNYVDSANVTIILAFNGTDFDADSSHVNITVAGSELASGSALTSNNITIFAAPETITWCNLQYPPNGIITLGNTFSVYAQVYVQGVTDSQGQGAGIEAWIGYSPLNTNPSTWTAWFPATYNQDVNNNDEYTYALAPLSADTFFYASRFRVNGGLFYYGGYNTNGGGLWDGITNVSDTLIVNVLVGINEISNNKILFFPNPATNFLSIKADSQDDNILTINNSLVQIVLTDFIKSGISLKSYDISLFPKGIYFINVKSNSYNITKPLIIR